MNGPARRPADRRRKAKSSEPIGQPASTRPLKIGEAARLLGVKPYVLRFWQTEFAILKPTKTASKHRLYNPKDIELLQLIRRLLYEERFTIDGARRRLRELGYSARTAADKGRGKESRQPERLSAGSDASVKLAAKDDSRKALVEIHRDLQSLYEMLKN